MVKVYGEFENEGHKITVEQGNNKNEIHVTVIEKATIGCHERDIFIPMSKNEFLRLLGQFDITLK